MIEVGKKAPAFTLESSDGGKVKLSDHAGKVVVVYFYPRDNTPGCTVEAQDFSAAIPDLKKLGAVVLGISKDSIASHCKFRDKYELKFPLLTDADGKTM
jgi:peroxiredoxin Q/BCP